MGVEITFKYLICLNPLLLSNIPYDESFKHFVVVFVDMDMSIAAQHMNTIFLVLREAVKKSNGKSTLRLTERFDPFGVSRNYI